MDNLLIIKEIEKMALDPSLEGLVLFGESGLVETGTGVYDLIFHGKQTNPYKILRATSLVIPVLRLPNDNQDSVIEKVYNEYLQHPLNTKYAVAKNRLNFYEVHPKEHGKEIDITGRYNRVGKRDFFTLARGTKLAREVMEKIRIIDKRYQAAF